MSGVDKSRFVPEESGRLVTAFLERFFERYVSYDYTAELEEELDDVSGGRLDWQKLLDDFWRDFKPKAGEVMDQKPSEITAGARRVPRALALPAARRRQRSAGLPAMRQRPAVTARRQVRRIRRLLELSRLPLHRRSSARAATRPQSEGPKELGDGIMLKTGRFGPYVERGDKRASIPKDVPLEDVNAEVAEKLLSLPREIGPHPETGKPITASIGRYGPVPRARRQICEARLDGRSVRDRHERSGRQACRRGLGRRTTALRRRASRWRCSASIR